MLCRGFDDWLDGTRGSLHCSVVRSFGCKCSGVDRKLPDNPELKTTHGVALLLARLCCLAEVNVHVSCSIVSTRTGACCELTEHFQSAQLQSWFLARSRELLFAADLENCSQKIKNCSNICALKATLFDLTLMPCCAVPTEMPEDPNVHERSLNGLRRAYRGHHQLCALAKE